MIFSPFATKSAYVQTKNLPEPKKITQAALSLLGTFSMSVPPGVIFGPVHCPVSEESPEGYCEIELVSWRFPSLLKGWDFPRENELSPTAHRTRVCISEMAAISSRNCAPRAVEARQAGRVAAWRTAGGITRSVNQPLGSRAVVGVAHKDTSINSFGSC